MGNAPSIALVLLDFSFGGSERIGLRLANAWAADGHKVSVICGSRTGPLLSLVGHDVEVIELKPPMDRASAGRKPFRQALERVLRQARPGILFVPGNSHFRLIRVARSLPARLRPVVVAKLSNPLRRDDKTGLRRWVFEFRTRRRLSQADVVVAMSPALGADASAVLGADFHLETIPQPTLDAGMSTLPPTGPRHRIVVAARLTSQKNLSLAIRAFAALDRPDLVLTMLGEGPERESLEALAAESNLGQRIEFAGYVQDIRPYLDRAMLLLITSAFEGFPAVAVEALAAGVPVVASACSPAIFEILDRPERGTVVESSRPEDFAEAMRVLLDRPEPHRSQLSEAVQRHTIGPISRQYLALFDRLRGDRSDAV